MGKHLVSGLLLLDKPQAMTSQTAVSKVKHLLKSPVHDSKKAGHTGTLDPMATGLLPICFGSATGFAGFGLDADKGYMAVIQLGAKTDTGDQDGQIIQTALVPDFDDEQLSNLAQDLLGEQWQTPPMYSALKKNGKKLYELAREGIEVERVARPIVIKQLKLYQKSRQEICLEVLCSKGTYVRVLGETIAERLQTVGHLTALRRTSTGGFDVSSAITLDNFERLSFDERLNALKQADCLVNHLPNLKITDEFANRLRLGQRLHIFQIDKDFKSTGLVRLYANGVFVGLGEIETSGRLKPKKVLSTP